MIIAIVILLVFNLCISLLDCHNKVPKTRRTKQSKLTVSQFWKLEGSDQRVCKSGSSEGCKEESVQRFSSNFWWSMAIFGIPWLIENNSDVSFILTWQSHCVCVCVVQTSLSYKDASHIGLARSLLISFKTWWSPIKSHSVVLGV